MEEQHDLAKWLEGKMTAGERDAFERTPEFASYNKIKLHSELLKAPDFDTESMYEQIMAKPKTKVKVIPMKTNWFLRIAAVLVLALGLFFVAKPMLTQTQTAENGATTTFSLPDDSQVTMNSGSQISYNKWNWNTKRCLDLKGEAFFKVTKGKTFDVNTELGKVTVVGTQFNVKSRAKRFEVTCFEGKVKVQQQGEIIFLTKGESVTFENGKKIESVVVDSNPDWMQNEIRFNKESLTAVIAELERKYNLIITTENIDNAQQFTGTIPTDNLDLALQIISTSCHFKYIKTAKNRITFTGK